MTVDKVICTYSYTVIQKMKLMNINLTIGACNQSGAANVMLKHHVYKTS